MARSSDLAALRRELSVLLSEDASRAFDDLLAESYSGQWHTNRMVAWDAADAGVHDYTFDDADGSWHDWPLIIGSSTDAPSGDIMVTFVKEGDLLEGNLLMTIDRQGTEDDALDFRIVITDRTDGEVGTTVSDTQSVATGAAGDVAVDLDFTFTDRLTGQDVSEGFANARLQYSTSNTGADWRTKSDVTNSEDPVIWKVRRTSAAGIPPTVFIGFDGQSESNTPPGDPMPFALARELRSRGYEVTTRSFAANGTTINQRDAAATEQAYIGLETLGEYDHYIMILRGGYADIAAGDSGALAALELAVHAITPLNTAGGWTIIFVGMEKYLVGFGMGTDEHKASDTERLAYQAVLDGVEGSTVDASLNPTEWFGQPTEVTTHTDGIHLGAKGVSIMSSEIVDELERRGLL